MDTKDNYINLAISPNGILYQVSKGTGVAVEDIKSKCRKREFSFARHLFCYLTCNYTTTPLKKIGSYIGNRDHSSVIHGRDNISDILDVYQNKTQHIHPVELKIAKLGVELEAYYSSIKRLQHGFKQRAKELTLINPNQGTKGSQISSRITWNTERNK